MRLFFPFASADTGRLNSAAQAGLARIWRSGFRYKKAGVVFLELVPAARVQGGLFDRPDDARSHSRMRAIDALNRRYGRGTLAWGVSTGRERQGWKMRRDLLSAVSERELLALLGNPEREFGSWPGRTVYFYISKGSLTKRQRF